VKYHNQRSQIMFKQLHILPLPSPPGCKAIFASTKRRPLKTKQVWGRDTELRSGSRVEPWNDSACGPYGMSECTNFMHRKVELGSSYIS